MTIQEAYLYIQDRLNNYAMNNNQSIPAHTFIRTMRAATYFWLDERIKLEEGDATRQREKFPFLESTEIFGTKEENFYHFTLPRDFYHKSNFRVRANKGKGSKKCNSILEGVLVESSNIASYLGGDDTRPNFYWEQTLITLEKNSVKVWYNDFKIDSLLMTYYRHPVLVNMESGFTDVNNVPTVDVDPELTGSSIYEVLNLTALILSGDTSSPKYQAISGLMQYN